MVVLELTLDKYGEQGDKTGWTFVKIDASVSQNIKPNTKKSYRVKGLIDNLEIKQAALIPIGNGDFILPVNNTIRKKIGKGKGDKVLLKLEEDTSAFEYSADLLACLEDEPTADSFYKTLSPSHQRYFSKWIESAKTIETKTTRITRCLFGLANQMDYGAMIRHFKGQK